MEYSQSLYGHFKKSKKQLISGIFILLISIVGIFIMIYKGYPVTKFIFIYCLFSVFYSFIFIAQAKGYIFNDFFGKKSFVNINEEQIRIKTINKEKQILWKDIKKVNLTFRGGYIKITTEDRPQNLILVSNIDYEYRNQIKSVIKKIAESKNIELIENELKK